MDTQTDPEPISGGGGTFKLAESCSRLPVDHWKNCVIASEMIKNTNRFYNAAEPI